MPESTKLAVIGGGPGGYAAAFKAADLGVETAIIDTEPNPGGVCLYRGCIPSKALLHAARVLSEAREARSFGIEFGEPRIDVEKLRGWKDGVVRRLTGGLGQLSKARKVRHIQGRAKFLNARSLEIQMAQGRQTLEFEHAIIATGSRPAQVPALKGPRFLDSTSALELKEVPKRLLVVGGGYIGLELGTVYAELGSRVSVVEMLSGLLPGADRDLVRVLQKRLETIFESIRLDTKVESAVEEGGKVRVEFTSARQPALSGATPNPGGGEQTGTEEYDAVLVSVGRRPNSQDLGLENTKVVVDPVGFIKTDLQRRTAEPTLFAIGDVAGEPMLAHKASHEGFVAAEAVAGKKSTFEPRAIPAVVFTDPELAWCGLTETQAQQQGREVKVARFTWGASGRALTLGRTDGLTKIVADAATEQVLGLALVGPGAGELISEGALAIEMGARVSDLSLTIHPHPTLSETIMESAEVFFGQSTHFIAPKRG